MKLDRREPHLGPHPELLTYRCRQCGHIATVVAEEELDGVAKWINNY
jgi:hypothetical protein